MPDPIYDIEVTGLRKAYPIFQKPVHRLLEALTGGRWKLHQEFWALKGIDFKVQQGTCVGIVGKNGSGKSTLLQILAGTLRSTQGNVAVRGRVAALLELGAGFDPEFTGRENVFNYGMTLGMTRQEVEERFDSILAFSEIDDFIDQPVKTYSSGMFMRLAFAVAVHVDPEVLIVDEALSVGDFRFQQKCLDRMHAFKEQGRTILVVSHSLGVIQNYCDLALWLDRGQQVAFAEAEKVARYYFDDYDQIPDDETPPTRHDDQPTSAEDRQWQYDKEDGERARTLDFQISGADGTARTRFRSGDKIRIKWRLEVLQGIQQPNIGLAIETADTGRAVFATSARNDGFKPPDLADAVELEFTLPDCRLLRGRYMVRVTVTNTRGITMYARVNQLIEMDHDGLEWGIARLDVDYRLDGAHLKPAESAS